MAKGQNTKGVIFNIQRYSIHDGPGIRTTVFLKGCPLRCLTCQNPESQTIRPELFFNADRCRGCGECVQVCPEGAIDLLEGRSRTNRVLCNGSGKCVEVCPNEARSLMGRYITAAEAFREAAADDIFYRRSGGGVTLSGGEALFQPRFAMDILRLCRKASIHTTLDTCGYAKWDTARKVLEYVDLVLYDLKHMDPVEHEKFTGVSNELIIENARKIHHELHIPLQIRVPIIPGCNDSIENIEATAEFIATELDSSIKVNLLPYHRLGETKYERLERVEQMIPVEPPDERDLVDFQQIFESYGLTAQIGG